MTIHNEIFTRFCKSNKNGYFCPMAALYFHIPFCKRLCGYCDFMRSVKLRYIEPVVAQMERELVEQADFLTDKSIRTIYFGGGTPSLLPPQILQRFIERAAQLFDTSQLTEITVEVNPDDVTEQYVQALSKTAINRVSLGIQSLDNQCLEFMGRRHSAEQAVAAVNRLKQSGFNNISVDVIFGVDGYCGQSLERTLDGILALDIQHISAYHLTIEPATRFGRLFAKGEMGQVTEEYSEAEFAAVHSRLVAAGFEHYEVSNFAKVGFRSAHNSSYWKSDEYLGIGPGAHSFAGGIRRWCEQSVESYVGKVEYGSECLSSQDALNEYVMVSLRRVEGIDTKTIAERWSEDEAKRITKAAERFVSAGWLVKSGSRLSVPPEHFLVSDAIIAELFEV